MHVATIRPLHLLYRFLYVFSDDMSKWVRELTSEGQMRWVGPEKVENVIVLKVQNILPATVSPPRRES